MRIARVGRQDELVYGIVVGPPDAPLEELELDLISNHPVLPFTLTGERLRLAEVKLVAPVLPTKIVCIGKNYADHAKEMGGEAPTGPVLFLKPSTAVCNPGDPIVLPRSSQRVDFEGELAVVMGGIAKDVPPARVRELILGFTCANDVTARDEQAADGQWTRGKGHDTFCPLGPWLETEIEPADLLLRTTLDGEVRQEARTALLLHDVPSLISFVSRHMTLLPGDVVLTGTPAGVGPMTPGQRVTVEIEGIGELTNPVVAA